MGVHPTGINHLAMGTRDIKAQIEFFADVLGCKLKALFWMHGVEGAYHCMLELSPHCYISFVQHPANADTVEIGVTHAGSPLGAVTAGAMQHVSLNVDSIEDLHRMRNRIRDRGIFVLGPLDHSTSESIYFAGPEGLVLELTVAEPYDDKLWIDPEVVALAGIDDRELARYLDPPDYALSSDAVRQPGFDPTKPHMIFPGDLYEKLSAMSDEQIRAMFSVSETPVRT